VKRFLVFWLLLVAVLSGCAADRQYVQVRRNAEVESIFRSGSLTPGYRYYFTGPDAEPIALMALGSDYHLRSMFWHEFSTSFQLNDWITGFDRIWGQLDDIAFVTIIYRGHEILSRDNRRIGMIYSKYDWVVAWWGDDEHDIYVTQPEPGGNQRAPQHFLRWREFRDR